MTKVDIYRADGSRYLKRNRQTGSVPVTVVRADGQFTSGEENTGSRTQASAGGWVNSLINNASSIIGSTLSGVSSVVAAKTGNYPEIPEEDSTPKVLAIAAVAAIVLIVILLIIFKK